MGFQCVVVHAAEDGLDRRGAVSPERHLLDINLPDFSGLRVLDQLKRDPRTRHIPVHVVSVVDYRREALELGAAGYALKPAKREELTEALKRLERKLSQSVRRVLIVEDDARQRESIRELLGQADVQITDAETAQQALQALSTTTFDCVVLDFNLPDATGYDLLEKMAQQDEVSFPPVIVYTGRRSRGRRSSGSDATRGPSSSRTRARRSGCWTRSRCFLHQVESKLPAPQQQMLKTARNRDRSLEGRRILVVEDDVRNIFALTSVFEPNGATVEIARNGREALEALARSKNSSAERHRHGAHGHHDARDGRAHRHARDPQGPRLEEAADHRAHREGDEGRSREVPRRRRERLRRQAPRCREAPVAGARMDAEIESAYALASRKFDIEFKLLIEAIYHLYHYDFRDYAQASLRRRLKGALVHFSARRCRNCRIACCASRRCSTRCSITSPCR